VNVTVQASDHRRLKVRTRTGYIAAAATTTENVREGDR